MDEATTEFSGQDRADPRAVLVRATGRGNVDGAIRWIAEGHPLEQDSPAVLRAILRALLSHDSPAARTARERLTRRLAASSLDTAAFLVGLEDVIAPARFRRALDALAWKSPTGSLEGLTPISVLNAQRAEPAVMTALCAMAGLPTANLDDWVEADLPSDLEDDWSRSQVREAFELIDEIVEGEREAPIASAEPLRALELMAAESTEEGPTGWTLLERMRRGGVPYEVLLAQREAGGAWLAHRNATSGKVSTHLADDLCEKLDDHQLDYLRSSRVGGTTSRSELAEMTGASGSIALVVRDPAHDPVAAVAMAIARDGGTARASGSRLLKLRDAAVPVYLLLAGPGWAKRNETADLAEAFDGKIYTDEHLDQLARTLAGHGG